LLRYPEIGIAELERLRGKQQAKLRRKNSYDGVGIPIQLNRAADHSGIRMKSVLPQAIAHDHHAGTVERAFFSREISPESRLNTEKGEEIRRDRRHVELLRTVWSAAGIVEHERAPRSAGARGKFHQAAALPVVLKIGRGNSGQGLALAAVVVPNDGEARGVAIRHAAEEDAVHNAENRGVCADAKRERDYGEGGERRAFPQHSGAENQVLPKRSHWTPPRTLPSRLRGMFVASPGPAEIADWT